MKHENISLVYELLPGARKAFSTPFLASHLSHIAMYVFMYVCGARGVQRLDFKAALLHVPLAS